MGERVPERLNDPALVAWVVRGEDWPRSLLSTPRLPSAWMGLVAKPDGRRRLVPPGEAPDPEQEDRLLLVRAHVVGVPLAVTESAADGHEVKADCVLGVRWPPRDDDLAALWHSLEGRGELTLEGLAGRIADGGGTAGLRAFVAERPAERLVREDWTEALLVHLRERLKRLLFTSGLVLERLERVRFASASLERAEALRRAAAERVAHLEARERVEQAARQATQRRLSHLAEVLEKLKAAAGAGQELRWRELLPALTPGERGRLLENLWRLTPDRTRTEAIVVVAGRECLWLEPEEPGRIHRRVRLGDDLGGLRSVRFCARPRRLLVGAASGIWLLDEPTGEVLARYPVPDAGRPRTGFNSAVLAGDVLVGAHSQLGVWCWPLESPGEAEPRLTPIGGRPRTIRGATLGADDCVLVAAEAQVHVFSPTTGAEELLPPAPGTIECLARDGGMLYAGTSGGELAALNLARPDGWIVLHRAPGPFESVQPRRWDDLLELVIPAERTLTGVFPQERIVVRLLESPVALRRAWVGDDILVGLSEGRDRLVVQGGAGGPEAGRVVLLSRQLGHSIQDACLVVTSTVAEGSSA